MLKIHLLRCGLSSASAALTRPHRGKYFLEYPTKVVLSDGSSITVRYHEPQQIIKLPLDLSTLSEAEAKARLERRRPKVKVVIENDDIGIIDKKKYLKLIKNKK
ncbi:39S ribosomal protein L55, mitochondrial [Cimex lectularius]|uniref:39S ribosomal protein L55, mitochondrial n=1 Tax=Cimex lectularius TaxID=79782 RepID=A0A8I6RQH4_CIMLE|nr:39S ribosomal protein L55, mitochondrial [Cimex lectularius]